LNRRRAAILGRRGLATGQASSRDASGGQLCSCSRTKIGPPDRVYDSFLPSRCVFSKRRALDPAAIRLRGSDHDLIC